MIHPSSGTQSVRNNSSHQGRAIKNNNSPPGRSKPEPYWQIADPVSVKLHSFSHWATCSHPTEVVVW